MKLSVLSLAFSMLCSNMAFAGSQTGVINLYHLNSDIDGRGVCVRMAPNLPGTGWACLWKNNSLYSEITNLLLEGYSKKKQCKVRWGKNDRDGHLLINLAECR